MLQSMGQQRVRYHDSVTEQQSTLSLLCVLIWYCSTLLLLILITGKFCMKGSVTLCKERKPTKSEHQRKYLESSLYSSVQSLSRVWRLTTPWTAARQFSLSITSSQSLFKLMPIESVVPSNHLILCRSLLLLPSIFPSIRVFSNESTLPWGGQSVGVSASASVLPMNIQDWFPLGLTVR